MYNKYVKLNPEINIYSYLKLYRVYKEDLDEESWELVASSKDELVSLLTKLKVKANLCCNGFRTKT